MKRNHHRLRFSVPCAVVVIAIGVLAICPAMLPANRALSAMNPQERGGRTTMTPVPPPNPPSSKTAAPRKSVPPPPTSRRPNVASQLEQALLRGNVQLKAKNYAQAEKEYRHALRLGPNDFRAYCRLGDVFHQQSSDSDAVQAYELCVRADAGYAHNRLGSIYLSQQRYPEAIAQFKKGVELNPKDPTDYYNLGLVYDAQQRYPEAIEQYKKAIERDPKYVRAYNQMGDVYVAQRRYPEAIEQFKKAIELDPKAASAYDDLGSAYYAQQRYPEAIEQYKKAIELDPKAAFAYFALGSAYHAQQRYPEAIEQYKRAIELNPNVAVAQYYLGLAYVYTNNKTAAMEQYEALKNLKSEYADKLLSEINKPQLAFTKQEDFQASGQNWTRYYLSVTNRASYPNEMFAPAPDLPPCGLNTNSSRTWVDIFDGAGKRLQGFCALPSSDYLVGLWFALLKGQAPPSSVYIVLSDRRTNVNYSSALLAIPLPGSNDD